VAALEGLAGLAVSGLLFLLLLSLIYKIQCTDGHHYRLLPYRVNYYSILL
jgi:hypothetical protein